MFCIICRKHDTIHPQNKRKKFNTEPSIRYKRKTVEEHASHQQHLAAVEAELLSRVSVIQHQVNYRGKVREAVYYNAFLSLYWVAKEELADCKFVRLLVLVEDLGITDLQLFQRRSSSSVREMFLLLGKMIKEHVCEKARRSNCFGLLSDEVCDISCKEQLVTFVKFVDPDNGKASTEFLATDDVLEHSTSANAEANKTILIKQLNESQLELKKLTSFSSDGASVMTGKRNGVAILLQKESKVMLNDAQHDDKKMKNCSYKYFDEILEINERYFIFKPVLCTTRDFLTMPHSKSSVWRTRFPENFSAISTLNSRYILGN